MNCILTRQCFFESGIFSRLESETGTQLAITLEHAYTDKDGKFIPKIPDGVYTCKRRRSPHFGYDLFEILNVPNCTFIEIHIGNKNADSHGCVCLGEQMVGSVGQEMVTHSRDTFDNFMTLQTNVDEWQLTVLSPASNLITT